MAPAKVAEMRKAGEEWLEYVDWVEEAAAEAKKTAEDRIRTSPKPASIEAQVSA
jgi:hypothetical protein